jgi:hypothetical protein
MTSYISLLSKIEAFCNAHLQIKKYGGEFREQMPNFATKDEKYPVVFVTPTSDTEALNTNQFTVDIYCVDIIQADRANLNSIISDCQLILKDMYVYYTNDNDVEIDVVGTASMNPLNNQDLDYVAGWVMSITFEVASYGSCAIPMNPINPNPFPGCEDATQIITDSSDNVLYTNSIPSGATETQVIEDSKAFLKDTLGTTISTTSILAEGSEDIVAPDSTYLVEYVNGTDIQSGSIVSGGSVTVQVPNPVTCEDATVNVNGVFWDSVPSGGTENVIVRQSLGSTQVGSKQGQYWRIADSTAVLKTTGGTTISTTSIKAEASANIVAPNTTIEVNGTTEGTFNAGSTVDIQLSDSGGVVTPDSVTVVGNDVQIVLADAVGAPVGATLMKTGQTTSYRTGDDGDLEAGRATSFFVLASNNPFGNTNRFTDELGGQTYTNNIVIDWSTYNGSTVLGYRRTVNGVNITWADAIDGALALSIGTFTSGWRLPNRNEFSNLWNGESTLGYNYSPINLNTPGLECWTSNSLIAAATVAWFNNTTYGQENYKAKTNATNSRYIPVRTFTVTGTTLT